MPRNLSNRKERSDGAELFFRLWQSSSVDEALEDFAKIAAENGIRLYSVRFKRESLERELKLPNAGASAGRIDELVVCVGGGQTQFIVKFCDPADSAVVRDLWCAAHLAAYYIDLLAGGGPHPNRVEKRNVDHSLATDGLIGESELVQEVRQDIATAASSDLSVLITGEPGTGKELIAKGIHNASSRAKKPFVDVNCASFNLNLIESELFGHEKGAFTGASDRKPGRFEMANGGTLFLDEIGDFPLESQPKLLRVLQEHKLERVGGREAIKIDARVVAATNHDLLRDIDEGRFRRDLYDRLCGYHILTPALREHHADVPILIRHYYPFVEFQEEALEMLCRYHWPGNVRELRLIVERMIVKAGSGRIITADYVRREICREQRPAPAPGAARGLPELREDETLTEYLRWVTLTIYERERARLGSHSAAARRLGINRTTLYDWLERSRRRVTK